LFTSFVGERKFWLFDKLTVKPMSSESAAVAAGDAPRDGIQISLQHFRCVKSPKTPSGVGDSYQSVEPSTGPPTGGFAVSN
jgi:hypothetical protein